MQRICELRMQKGYTQEFLGHLIGCDRRTISRYENGLREPDMETSIQLAKALHTTTDYLLNLSNVPHETETPYSILHREEFHGLSSCEIEELARSAILIKSKRNQNET